MKRDSDEARERREGGSERMRRERGREGAIGRGRGARREQGRSEGGSEEWSKGGGNFKEGTLPRTTARMQCKMHKTTHNAALALETLLLQRNNSERASFMNSVL